MGQVKVKQPNPPADIVEPEILAEAIVRISHGVRRLMTSGLNFEAVVVLLADSSKQSKLGCRVVLEHLEKLEKKYTRRK